MLLRLALFLFSLSSFNVVFGFQQPVINTPNGQVRGYVTKSYNGKEFSNFLGVPYAQPPINDLRFSEPQPAKPWSGIWEANITTLCSQITHTTTPEGGIHVGEEDCLHVNVYVPKVKHFQDELLDVIVHIHGGAFMFGAADIYAGPGYLMDRDVVLVTFNYRVGPFGFLSTEDEVVPGNMGMKDQVLALKWIQNNIKYFGGNPDSVTITGLSAGGSSVHYLLMSPLAEGLFHKGISVSGTALCPWAMQEAALEKTKKLADYVGCNQKTTKKIVDCLRQRTTKQLNAAVKTMRPWLYNPFSPLGIVVERCSKTAFLCKHPYKLLVDKKIQDLPWLTSVTADEGLYPAADFVIKETFLPYINKNWKELAPHILDYNYTVADKDSTSQKIREHYLKDGIISRKTFNQLIQMLGDRLFVVDAEKAARLQAKANKSPVYFYYYSFHGEEMPSLVSILTHYDSKYGISHGDDMMFVFTTENPPNKLEASDEKMKDIMLDVWISFIKNGKPEIKGVQWEPVSSEHKSNFKYVHIKSPDNIKIEETEELGQRSFWQSLDFIENENLFDAFSKTEL